MLEPGRYSLFFFFNDTATTEIYTLSLHDALPISVGAVVVQTVGSLAGASLRKALFVIPPLKMLDTVGGLFAGAALRSEEHTSELQSQSKLACRLLLEKKKNTQQPRT